MLGVIFQWENGVTTLHHNPLVGRGGGGKPQGGKVKQESLAWFPLTGLARGLK